MRRKLFQSSLVKSRNQGVGERKTKKTQALSYPPIFSLFAYFLSPSCRSVWVTEISRIIQNQWMNCQKSSAVWGSWGGSRLEGEVSEWGGG